MSAEQPDVAPELRALRLQIADVRASRKRVTLSSDADRRSIERSLHEGLQQQLVGLAANLEIAIDLVDADPPAARTLLVELGRDAQRALEDTRTLAHRIYPPLLEAGGLRAALRSAAADADVQTRIDVPAGASLPPETACAVYFCCLEVFDRAGAGTSVAVTVRNEGGAIAFEVVADRDLGSDRLALIDRVEALGGRLTIRARPGEETRLTGSLPLSR